jgi:hypothetical protein
MFVRDTLHGEVKKTDQGSCAQGCLRVRVAARCEPRRYSEVVCLCVMVGL